MPRRLLRLPSSSDEDEERNPQTPYTNPNPNLPPPPPVVPLVISDDEVFIDVPDAFSPPSPPPVRSTFSSAAQPDHGGSPEGMRMDDSGDSSVGEVDEFFRRIGLRLRMDWLESCFAGMASSHPGFERLDVTGKAKICFEQFLLSDMNYSGQGILPENVHNLHKAELEGPFVLQVDEVVNISCSLRHRYHETSAGSKRCLKLSMTDGAQRVFGMEYMPIRELEVHAAAGLKVAIRNVHVRRGLLLLVPEVLEVLGGVVNILDEARQRLVSEVNKPPRSKRKQSVLPLSQRATLAAWPSNTGNNSELANLTSHGPYPPLPFSRVTARPRSDAGEPRLVEFTNSHSGRNIVDAFAVPNARSTVEDVSPPFTRRGTAENCAASRARAATIDFTYPINGSNTTSDLYPVTLTGRITDEVAAPLGVRSNIELGSPHTRTNTVEVPGPYNGLNVEANASSNSIFNVEDVVMMEQTLTLSGTQETPFTYLSCLFTKWAVEKDRAPFVQGKIKCFLTGVKTFQFKQRSMFELLVYVDDGSLISEILVDHHVVQKGIGHSPEEVTTALSSIDKKIAADMREIMKRFQLFLAKFEGMMLIEINGDRTHPMALEMKQGCSTSDAWLLLRRVKTLRC